MSETQLVTSQDETPILIFSVYPHAAHDVTYTIPSEAFPVLFAEVTLRPVLMLQLLPLQPAWHTQ